MWTITQIAYASLIPLLLIIALKESKKMKDRVMCISALIVVCGMMIF